MSSEDIARAWCLICGLHLTRGHNCPPLRECRECRQPFRSAQFEHEVAQRMTDESTCYHCLRWGDAAARAHLPESVRISGRHYIIGPEETDEAAPRGFAGQRFTIRFDSGRVIESTNLWSQGPVPNHFRDRLPDNAVWEIYPW